MGGWPTRIGEVGPPEILGGATEEKRNSSRAILTESQKQVPPQLVLGARGLEVDEGGRYVSSSDKEKVITDRARVVHRRGRAEERVLVCALETRSP